MSGMFLKGNPLESPPVEIVEQGNDAINSWFDSFKDGIPKRALNEAKILLVGDGGAGKTSLVKRLFNEDFDEQENKTDGILIRPWSPPSNDSLKINIWDFGGQEIMHATHQFFLTKRSLYIVVLDMRKEEKPEYWLKHVNSFGGDSPVLVVLNKMDQHPGRDLNRRHLLEKYPNIKGFCSFSCKTGEGLDDLVAKLSTLLENMKMIHTPWALPWFNVKKALENMRSIRKKPYIDKKEYDALCAQHKIGDQESRRVLVEFLNDLGVVVHHKDFKLKGTHVLDPKWVTTGVYKIINSEDVKKAGGLLPLSRLETLLSAECKEGYCYTPEAQRFISDLMQKFQLCFEVEDGLLIPDLLPEEQPEFHWPEAENLLFRFQYDFLPPSVLPRFMVKMHKDIDHRLRWRTGVVLTDTEFGCRALVKADMDDKRIVVRVKGGQKRDYFSALLFELRRINSSFEKLDVQELVSVPDDPKVVVPYDHLLLLEKNGTPDFIPYGAQKGYNVKELLGSVKVPLEEENLEEIRKILEKLVDAHDTEESFAQKANELFEFKPKILGLEFNVSKWFKQILEKEQKKKKK
ncbi:MAG: GTP-binding protein, partial [bacterium]|nr:GTP-binding protein [bacterium]